MAQTLSAAAQSMKEAFAEALRKRSLWLIVQGGLMTIAGIVAIFFPLFSGLAVVVVIGWLLIINAAFQGISLIGVQDAPHFWMQILSVGLGFVLGLLLLSHPGEGLVLLTILLVAFFFLEGLSKIVFSLIVRPLPNWSWILLSGIFTIILSIVLWSLIPVAAAWLLGFLLGLCLISQGLASAYFAWSLRRQPPPA